MYKIGEAEMVLCPYNRHHIVNKLRIQKHLIKCQKLYPDVKLAACFYNYSHRLKPEDLLAHYEICSHKTRIEGSRYGEPSTHPSSAAASDNNLPQNDFPEINAKTKFFRDPPVFVPNLNKKFDEDSQKFDTPDEESEDEDFHLTANQKVAKVENDYDNDEDDDDDDLEPLPLPKTVSKAFVFSKQQISKTPTVSSQCKPIGRGTSSLAFLPHKESRTSDHLLPDLSDMDSTMPKRETKSKFFKNPSITYSKSVVSSKFDDTSTLKSEQVLFDNEFIDDDNGFILKNFDKYTKI